MKEKGRGSFGSLPRGVLLELSIQIVLDLFTQNLKGLDFYKKEIYKILEVLFLYFDLSKKTIHSKEMELS